MEVAFEEKEEDNSEAIEKSKKHAPPMIYRSPGIQLQKGALDSFCKQPINDPPVVT